MGEEEREVQVILIIFIILLIIGVIVILAGFEWILSDFLQNAGIDAATANGVSITSLFSLLPRTRWVPFRWWWASGRRTSSSSSSPSGSNSGSSSSSGPAIATSRTRMPRVRSPNSLLLAPSLVMAWHGMKRGPSLSLTQGLACSSGSPSGLHRQPRLWTGTTSAPKSLHHVGDTGQGCGCRVRTARIRTAAAAGWLPAPARPGPATTWLRTAAATCLPREVLSATTCIATNHLDPSLYPPIANAVIRSNDVCMEIPTPLFFGSCVLSTHRKESSQSISLTH